MDQVTLSSVLSYAGTLFGAGLLIVLLSRRLAVDLWEISVYLLTALSVGAVRSYTLARYGFASHQYGTCYWTTDLVLVLAAFVLVVSFFRRACSENAELWQFVKLLLGAVLIAIAAVSYFSLARHEGEIFSSFIIEFSQNLYFASLVLTTLLYLMTLRMEIADERLGLLVCGLGIEFAGPAAGLALVHLTSIPEITRVIGIYFVPLCDAGMILTWFYAISRVPGPAKAPRSRVEPVPAFARGNLSQF
jgi:hypothetical protein